ncbi:hypothetical protein [Chitinivorax sp. B]|nr:hypothetical protein [Chitinivorax sp. B]
MWSLYYWSQNWADTWGYVWRLAGLGKGLLGIVFISLAARIAMAEPGR